MIKISGIKKLNIVLVSILLLSISGVIEPKELVHAQDQCSGGNFVPPASQDFVHYNWGNGSPAKNVDKDHFCAEFKQIVQKSGDYFLSTFADDGVKVTVNGQNPINRWSDSAGEFNKGLALGLSSGDIVKTDYYEKTGDAVVFSAAVPLGGWIGYYYENENLKGKPLDAKIIERSDKTLYENFGYGAPTPNLPVDHFSARYITARHMPSGEYIIRGRADDGIRILVDGKVVLDRWTPSAYREDAVRIHVNDVGNSDIHWVEVQYYDRTSAAQVWVDVESMNDQITTSNWLGEIYPNDQLTGNPVIIGGKNAWVPIDDLNFDWGYDSPHEKIPKDNFSATFQKKITLEPGQYELLTWADDGVRVYMDNHLLIDSWKPSANEMRTKTINVDTKSTHTFKIDYLEIKSVAKIKFDIVPTYHANVDAVHENWGNGSPDPKVPNDNFYATFNQEKSLSSGDYFVQAMADDRVHVEFDGVTALNQWSDSSGKIVQAPLLNVKQGTHNIKTLFYENKGAAAVFSDVVPFDSWLAYYYNNEDLEGKPLDAKIITRGDKTLYENFGYNSPTPKINADHFSARYVTAKHLPAGDYIIRGRADDGIRILVDGKTVLDRWTSSAYREDAVKVHINDINGSNIHWVEIQYFDRTSIGMVWADVEPINDQITTADWLGEVYPNDKMTGNPIIIGGKNAWEPIKGINFDWGYGSPSPLIPSNHFTARFHRKYQINEAGDYKIRLIADDGAKVYIDNKLVLDGWQYTVGERNKTISLSAGNHDVTIDYREVGGVAKLSFDLLKSTGPTYTYVTTNYPLTFNDVLNKQLTANPQTDKKYDTYIRSDGLKDVKNGTGIVDGTGWNVRGGPGTDYWSIGGLNNGEKVTILSTVKGKDGYNWYKINYNRTWVNPSPSDVSYYLNSSNFKKGTDAYFQFMRLSESAHLDEAEVNQKVLAGKGILAGKAGSFIQASQKYNINEIYLIAHALHETGNGTSKLANGVNYNGKKVYNMYGIGAKDSCPVDCGAAYAYDHGWFTAESAIIGGATFIDNNYISKGQDTLYKMRWNPSNPGTHQYATDIGWAVKQTSKISSLYKLLTDYTIVFDVPKYK